MAGAHGTAGKTGGGDQERFRAAESGLAAFRIGNAGHGERRVLGCRGTGDEGFGCWLGVVHQIERNVFRWRGGVGQPGIWVLRHHTRHRHGTFGQFLEAGRVHGAGRHDRRMLAQEHPQAEVAAFGALDVFRLAEAPCDGQGGAGDQHRIRRISAGGAGAGDEVG